MSSNLTPADAYDRAADIIEANGFYRHHWWNPAQAVAGIPLDSCRVDIVGALSLALHGSPVQVLSREVQQLEALLTQRIPAPSVAAWYSYSGIGQRDALRLLRCAADGLRTQAP